MTVFSLYHNLLNLIRFVTDLTAGMNARIRAQKIIVYDAGPIDTEAEFGMFDEPPGLGSSDVIPDTRSAFGVPDCKTNIIFPIFCL